MRARIRKGRESKSIHPHEEEKRKGGERRRERVIFSGFGVWRLDSICFEFFS